MAGVIEQLQTARALDPNDARIPCWLGASQVAVGRMTRNDALVQQGITTVEEGVAAFPEFNLFCRALVYADLPANHPEYARAVDAMFETMSVCYGTVDRNNPDLAPSLSLETDRGQKRVCWNSSLPRTTSRGSCCTSGICWSSRAT